jgi:hypothetical protein
MRANRQTAFASESEKKLFALFFVESIGEEFVWVGSSLGREKFINSRVSSS